MKIVAWLWLRTFRHFHWIPQVYPGVNGVKTNLLVIGWIGIEYLPKSKKIAIDFPHHF